MTTRPRFTFHLLSAFALAMLGVLTILAPAPGLAQTFKVLHNFTAGASGAQPYAGLTTNAAGDFYGTTQYGGVGVDGGHGVVFRLSRAGSGWIETPLYAFEGGSDGEYPLAGVVIGSDGALYGTTSGYNVYGSYGTVYRLTPPPSACESFLCPWRESVLYRFSGGLDGANPGYGNLAFDQAGNIYGTTLYGGGAGDCGYGPGCGVAYKLTPSGSGWTETAIWDFGVGGGNFPASGVTVDSAGNLYGTTTYGTVYELSPSGSGWTETTLTDGLDYAYGGLVFDPHGNLFGTTGGFQGAGNVYELSPSNGGWALSTLYTFSGYEGPLDTLTLNAAGDLYGTSYATGPYEEGQVFKLTPSNGEWIFTDLHDFSSGSGGSEPVGGVVFDASGNMYGTTSTGGTGGSQCNGGCGTVWEITP
jgi:uncharacterized repeat protein (TIGR03803 family)